MVKKVANQTWLYVLLNEDKIEDFNVNITTGIIDIADYGTVLDGGQDLPVDIIRKLRFKSYNDPEY